MKIAYYTDCNFENHDGPAINEQEFLLLLKREYNDNFIFITILKNRDFCKKHDINNVYFFEEVKLASITQKISHLKVARKLSRENFDVMVCRFIGIPLIPLFIKLFSKKKKIAIKTAALWYVDDIKTNNILDKIYVKIRDAIFRFMYGQAVVIDTALPYAKKDIAKTLKIDSKKIFLVENGINTNKFSLKTSSLLNKVQNNWPILGFMGSLPSSRGAIQILEIARRIINQYPNLGVVILGYDTHLDSIVKGLITLGVKVVAPGKVPYSNIEQYTQLMTIGFSFYEEQAVEIHGNASQKVRQYLSCGKPVFSIYHNHEFIAENDLGAIFKSNDYDLMAEETIKWVKRLDENTEDIAKRLRTYAVENLSVQSTFRKRLGIYNDILDRS